MMTVCNDPWYTAFVHVNGWAIRINAKKTSPNDFVAEIGTDPLLAVRLPVIEFTSAYWEKKFPLKYFTTGEPSTMEIIGNMETVKQDIVSKVLFHYFLIQVFREIVGDYAALLECDIYNHLLGLPGAEKMAHLRTDIGALYDLSKRMSKGLIITG